MNALRMLVWMVVLTGVVYPLSITAISQLVLPHKASGSLVRVNSQVLGSTLIGQKFSSEKYFWGRPSAVDYNPLPSGGSNLGPTSKVLKEEVEKRRKAYHSVQVPSDLLFASGSGLDPHITPETAYFQIGRVAKARGVEEIALKKLIDEQTKKRSFGFLGEKYVNVLELNLSLEKYGH